MKTVMTLCLAEQGDHILLGYKKRGFGKGRWNGFGGKVKDGESIEQATRREVLEECGISVGTIEKCGVLTFTFEGEEDALEMHIYRTTDFSGEPQESDEMRPQWFGVDKLPFDDMWPSDVHWYAHFLSGARFGGSFHFRKDVVHATSGQESILKKYIEEIEIA